MTIRIRTLLLAGLAAAAAGCGSSAPPTRDASAGEEPAPAAGQPLAQGDTVTAASLAAEPLRWAEKPVVASGACLGASGPARGRAPAADGSWQLGGGEAAVWVVGPAPAGCSASGAVAVQGVVKVDSIAVRGAGRVPRPYLVMARQGD